MEGLKTEPHLWALKLDHSNVGKTTPNGYNSTKDNIPPVIGLIPL